MLPIADRNFDALVTPTKLHRSLYTDPTLFELEMQRIWGQAWIFIGHESQVPEPGDYFTTHINHNEPVVLIRDKNQAVTCCTTVAVTRAPRWSKIALVALAAPCVAPITAGPTVSMAHCRRFPTKRATKVPALMPQTPLQHAARSQGRQLSRLCFCFPVPYRTRPHRMDGRCPGLL